MIRHFGFGFIPRMELVYSIIIISICLLIYYKTKESYELSQYKGIKYFRNTFLFFALAYFFQFATRFVRFTLFLTRSRDFFFITGSLALFLTMYASIMAITYLIYSFLWKSFDKKYPNIVLYLHGIALLVSLVIISLGNTLLFFLLQVALLLFAILASGTHITKSEKKKGPLHAIYVLLIVFWLLSIIDAVLPRFFITTQLVIYAISIALFVTILYKVLKKIKVKSK